MDIFSIYRITNVVTGKVYIGYTNNPIKRWKKHQASARDPKSKTKLHNSLRKHGPSNFKFEVIYQSNDKLHTKKTMEPIFIVEHDSVNNGYNITRGGDGGPGVTSKNASKYNKERVANGTHNFLSYEAKKISSETASATNARLLAAGTHILQSEKYQKENSERVRKLVTEGKHYWQSDKSKQEKRDLITQKRNRPILIQLQQLYKKFGIKAKGMIHRSDDRILSELIELQQSV